jgi:2-amino-4-hydroxy-6-hydroxymethyldihydropteridine diphosphokinase
VAQVCISIGSNVDAEHNVLEALRRLQEQFGELRISPVYRTAAVGFDGDDFLNLAVCLQSGDDVHAVAHILKDIEDAMGRDRSQPKFSARTIDLDLLLYNNLVLDDGEVQVPRAEILQHAFVLKPLSDLLGNEIHPVTGRSFTELWGTMESAAKGIEKIQFDLGKGLI